MTGLPCTCILENIKYSASSDVRFRAGCSQHQEVNVVKRNKDLASGELLVFVPSHRKGENVNAESSEKAENVSRDSRLEEWMHSCGLNFVKVKATSQVERGKYLVRLERPTIYAEVLKQTLYDSRSLCNHCMPLKSATAAINCAMLSDPQKEVSDDWSRLSLGHLRQVLVALHVARLLQGNGFLVSNITYPASKIVDNFVSILFGTDVASTVQPSSVTDDKTLASQLPASGFDCISLLEKYRSSPYAVEIDETFNERVARPDSSQSEESKELVEVVLDLKKFVADNSSQFQSQRNSLRKNLDRVHLNHSSSIISQISCLESHRLGQRIESEGSQSVLEQNSMCVHVTSYEREFNQHIVATAWKILEPTVDSIKQVHVVCGPVSSRRGAKLLEYAQDFFDLRYEQMKNAFTMKYGTNIQEDGWKHRVRSLTKAAVVFEMLSTVCRQEVKICRASDVSSDEHLDYKGGVFVMYNFARLSTLFLHFEEAVAKGTYPALVEFDSVDFSLLQQEEEWGLLFNYVLLYPDILKGTVEDSAESTFHSIHTHKICQFLLSLSSSLSIYYSKTHILCEPRPHLMPLMFARLYLMKGIQKIILNCFGLLGIEPCPQL